MKTITLREVDSLSIAKVFSVLNMIITVLNIASVFLFPGQQNLLLHTSEPMIYNMFFVIIVSGLFGFIGGFVIGYVYNFISGRVKGYTFDVNVKRNNIEFARIGTVQAGKTSAAVAGIFGVLFGTLGSIMFVISGRFWSALVALIGVPLMFTISGVIVGVFSAILYNAFAHVLKKGIDFSIKGKKNKLTALSKVNVKQVTWFYCLLGVVYGVVMGVIVYLIIHIPNAQQKLILSSQAPYSYVSKALWPFMAMTITIVSYALIGYVLALSYNFIAKRGMELKVKI